MSLPCKGPSDCLLSCPFLCSALVAMLQEAAACNIPVFCSKQIFPSINVKSYLFFKGITHFVHICATVHPPPRLTDGTWQLVLLDLHCIIHSHIEAHTLTIQNTTDLRRVLPAEKHQCFPHTRYIIKTSSLSHSEKENRIHKQPVLELSTPCYFSCTVQGLSAPSASL